MVVVENNIIKFYITDGILYSEYKERTDVDEDAAKSVIELRHKISNGINQYWCMDIRGVKMFGKQARDYVDIHGQDFLYACAVLVHSHLTKFMVNTYLKLKPPKVPMRVFTNKEDAVNWLLIIKSNNN